MRDSARSLRRVYNEDSDGVIKTYPANLWKSVKERKATKIYALKALRTSRTMHD